MVKTIADYIKAARVLIQDTTASPRYSDEEFKIAFDLAFDEAYRIRPDIFLDDVDPSIIDEEDWYTPPVPRGYQSAFLYYICGHVQLRDAEETEDARAATFLNKFVSQLLLTAA